jgi:hypothetical protein
VIAGWTKQLAVFLAMATSHKNGTHVIGMKSSYRQIRFAIWVRAYAALKHEQLASVGICKDSAYRSIALFSYPFPGYERRWVFGVLFSVVFVSFAGILNAPFPAGFRITFMISLIGFQFGFLYPVWIFISISFLLESDPVFVFFRPSLLARYGASLAWF